MSFFNKVKQTARKGIKNGKGVKRKAEKQNKRVKSDEEISSDDDFETLLQNDEQVFSSDEDENETPQEKRIRLEKLALEEIKREERKRLEAESEDSNQIDDIISKRLRNDYLKQVGRLQLAVADEYSKVNNENILTLKCKDQNRCVTCVCISSDANFIYSGSKDCSVVKWSLKERKKIGMIPKQNASSNAKLGHSKGILCLALTSDDQFLAVGDLSGNIQVWNAIDLKHAGTLTGHKNSVTGLVFRIGTHTLYSCSKDRMVKVWSVDEMSYVESVVGHEHSITSIDALTRECAITGGGQDTTIRCWKIAEESHFIFNGLGESIDVVRLINEMHFISGGSDGQICIWSVNKKKPLCSVQEAHGLDPINLQALWITAVAAFVNSDLVASGSYDGNIKLWKLTNNFKAITLINTIPLVGFVNDLRFSCEGEHLVGAIGCEHRFGRWTTVKAKNSVAVIPLAKS